MLNDKWLLDPCDIKTAQFDILTNPPIVTLLNDALTTEMHYAAEKKWLQFKGHVPS